MREFKDSITGKDKDDDESDATADRRASRPVDPAPAEPEVVTGETRPQDQPASRADVA